MIRHQNILDTIDTELSTVVQTLHWGAGRYDLHVLIGKINESEWPVYELQGQNLNELNVERAKHNLHPKDRNANLKIVESNWISVLKNGRGVVVVFTNRDFRNKSNKQIETALEWLVEKFPNLIVEKCENKKFDSFLLTFTKPKSKKIVVEQPTEIEQIENEKTV
jgi:hypothetical protein